MRASSTLCLAEPRMHLHHQHPPQHAAHWPDNGAPPQAQNWKLLTHTDTVQLTQASAGLVRSQLEEGDGQNDLGAPKFPPWPIRVRFSKEVFVPPREESSLDRGLMTMEGLQVDSDTGLSPPL